VRSTFDIEHPPQGSKWFKDPEVMKLLHIPRTGGHARAASLNHLARKGFVAICPHNTKASACVGPVVCFLRDPVTRFLSAARRLKVEPAALLEARERGRNHLTPAPELLLRDQTWWLDRDLVNTYQMEQLDYVWPMILEEYDIPGAHPLPKMGHPDRNESPGGLPTASSDVLRAIERSYDADMEAWANAYAY
jgi:hypothetical protein